MNQIYSAIFSKKQLFKSLNIVILIFALLGALQAIGKLLNNERILPFRSLKEIQPELLNIRYQIQSIEIKTTDSNEKHWTALQPSLKLLWAINPDIFTWIRSLYLNDRIEWKEQATLFNWPVIASYEWQFDTFYFAPQFWKLTEGQKASVIAHENLHYRQNKFEMINDTLIETLTGKLLEYGSKTEDEAHLYQWFAYRAMDMPPDKIVMNYFQQRNSYHFVLSQPIHDEEDK